MADMGNLVGHEFYKGVLFLLEYAETFQLDKEINEDGLMTVLKASILKENLSLPKQLHQSKADEANNATFEEQKQAIVQKMIVGEQESYIQLAFLLFENAHKEKFEAKRLIDISYKMIRELENGNLKSNYLYGVLLIYLWNKEYAMFKELREELFKDFAWIKTNYESIQFLLLFVLSLEEYQLFNHLVDDYCFLSEDFKNTVDFGQKMIGGVSLNKEQKTLKIKVEELRNLYNNQF